MEEPIDKKFGASGCLFRLYWMFVGNIVLFFLTVLIIDKHVKLPSWHDLAYWITVTTLLVVRYVDIHYLQGQTGEGKPATARDFRNYALMIIVVSALLWALTCILR